MMRHATASDIHAYPHPVGREIVDSEIVASRNNALVRSSAQTIQHLNENELASLQAILRHGDTFGYWKTPDEWAPGATSKATLNIDLRGRILSYLDDSYRQRYAESIVQPSMVDLVGCESMERKRPPEVEQVARLVDAAVLTLTRYLLLLRMGPSGFGGKGKEGSLDPTSVRQLGYHALPKLIASCIGEMLGNRQHSAQKVTSFEEVVEETRFFSNMPAGYLDELAPSIRKRTNIELQRMLVLASKGLWSDVPVLVERLATVTPVKGIAKPRPSEEAADPHLPLPDDYVSTMGSRSLWLIRTLGPALIPILEKFRSIWLATEDTSLSRSKVESLRKSRVELLLRDHVWRNPAGETIDAPPFDIHLPRPPNGSTRQQNLVLLSVGNDDADIGWDTREISRSTRILVWPPRNTREILTLAHTVQLAHLFVISMSLGGRKSEIVSLKRSCVHYSPDGLPFADGRTFKLVEEHEGAPRDWALPVIAVEALEQQVRLVQLVEAIGAMKPNRTELPPSAEKYMWTQSGNGNGDRTKRLLNINRAHVRFAITLGMSPAPCGQNIRTHRFRKTVARLVALALVQAPKVLMDVFGHTSLEMTLYYILTNKELQAEIERVSRELRVMCATQVVEQIVEQEDAIADGSAIEGYGGPAALAMQRAIVAQKTALHRMGAEWGVDSARELAEILTLRGKAWQYVRRGVICTKFPGTESGPCNKSKGYPEPSRCQAHCRHRLEEAFLREDVDTAIADAVNAYIETGSAGEELIQASWAGQIVTHLSRFEDLRLKWMGNPVVQQLLSAQNSKGGTA